MSTHSTRRLPPMRVVIVPEAGEFVAYCLGYNVAAHGETVDAARRAFVDALIGHVLVHEQVGRDPFGEPRTEPGEAHRLWDDAIAAGASREEFAIPGFTTRAVRKPRGLGVQAIRFFCGLCEFDGLPSN